MATRNRYAEIMSQYRQTQPYSFFGYPQSYTGGQSGYTGGYDVTPYTPYTAPANRYADIMAQPAAPMGGGGRGEREAPSAFSQMTPAERAAYYAANPIEGSIALGMQDLFGNATLLGNAAKYFGGDGWYDSRLEKMGVNPTISLENQNTLAGEAMQRALDSQAQSQALQGAIAAAQASREASAQASLAPGAGSGGGGGNRDGGIGGSSPGDPGRGGGGAHAGGGYAKGGHVSMQRLQGPNPAGPDDGYAALKDGEYVINDKAVTKYGIELMEAINSGKISKGKLRGLLEM